MCNQDDWHCEFRNSPKLRCKDKQNSQVMQKSVLKKYMFYNMFFSNILCMRRLRF